MCANSAFVFLGWVCEVGHKMKTNSIVTEKYMSLPGNQYKTRGLKK